MTEQKEKVALTEITTTGSQTLAINIASIAIAALIQLLKDKDVITEEDMGEYLKDATESFKKAADSIPKKEDPPDPSFPALNPMEYLRASFVPGFYPEI